MKRSWILSLLLSMMVLLLSGCSVVVPRLAEAWFTVGTSQGVPAPPVTPTDLSPEAEQVAMTVRQMLMQQVEADFDAVTIESVEAMEWPNGCLGLATPNEMCTQMIVPGYRVVLSVNGEQFVYRTDENANTIRLESAPQPQIGDVAVEWTSPESDGVCTEANIAADGIAFGQCEGTLMPGKLVNPDRSADLAEFVATFAPFEAETVAGTVVFHGEGSQEATPAQQRMIAEWARLVQLEAMGGRSGAGWGLAFAWHREGGIAGFCDDLSVYRTGQVYASSCKGNTPVDLGQTRLNAEQLDQLYTWIDTLQSFEIDQTDPAVADAMTVRMVFSGAGEEMADEAQQQAIQEFAGKLFAEVSRP